MALTSDQKGAIAESAVVHEALRLGIGVLRPVADGERYDLVLDLRPVLLRVQCKWAPLEGEVVVVRCYSSRRTASGVRRRRYEKGEIDAIAAYCPDLARCFVLAAEQVVGRSQITLRVAPCRNNQRAGVIWADACSLEALQSRALGP